MALPEQKILAVPYFRQLDNKSGQGYRECLSSSCAMLAAYYGKISGDDEYNLVRQRFGDTTSIQAQLSTLAFIGLTPRFYANGNAGDIRDNIYTDIPMAVGWLHRGPVSRPRGGGHWSVIVGYTKWHTIHHDPYGEANLVGGGYVNHSKGELIRYSFYNFMPRWCPDGPNSGWHIICL